eukprot:SAG11_NODE_5460_length_1553_cov_1.845254_1_plen_244_part_00
MHPSQNLLVTNLTAGAAPVGISLSTWAVSSGASPSVASLAQKGSVGLVTRRAVANDAALLQAKHVVAALGSSSPAIARWELAAVVSEAEGVEARAELTISPNQTVSIFTAFADNSLSNSSTAAHDVTAAASLAAATAANTPGTAAEVVAAVHRWWGGFWSKSGVSLPQSPTVERFWYASNYITASMAPTNPELPAPGLFGPWVTTDNPAFGGDYTLVSSHHLLTFVQPLACQHVPDVHRLAPR